MVLRAAADLIDKQNLGFKSTKIGCHSIRPGAIMVMHLDEVPVFTILLIGCWSSDAFLCYIQKQAKTKNVIHVQHFCPWANYCDPHQCNHRDNFKMRKNMAGFSPVARQLPQMTLWT